MEPKGLRSPNFAKRLRKACDDLPECPPLNHGRLVWLKSQLATEGLIVSVESIRKWLEGEGRPKQEKCEKLAGVLGVDSGWLYMGNAVARSVSISKSKPTIGSVIPVQIRVDRIVELHGVPLDLSLREANKIANVILAFAVPAE